ncbi:hypothetical protein ONZ45_g11218 [Pleurotus djamor]|nr:hypothetical protein ONZ45_g11218 [Pleurotus djamor]
MGQDSPQPTLGCLDGDSLRVGNSALNSSDRHASPVEHALSTAGRPQDSHKACALEHPASSEPPMLSVSPSQSTKSPKAILKRFTTKLRLPSSVPLPVLKTPPQPSTSFASSSQRENALRERGLLPPLHPNPDLSAQEQVQDSRYSVVIPIDQVEAVNDVSAASKIKQDWVARNKLSEESLSEVTRMRTFKFGGSTSSLPLPPSEAVNPSVNISSQLQAPPTILGPDTTSTAHKFEKPTSPPTRPRSGRPPALDLSQARKRSLSKPRPSPTCPLPPIPVQPDAIRSPKSVPLPVSPPPTPRTPSKLRETLTPSHTPVDSHFLEAKRVPTSPSPPTPSNASRTNTVDLSHGLLPSPNSPTFPPIGTPRSGSDHVKPRHGTAPTYRASPGSLSNVSVVTPSLVSPSQACTTSTTDSSLRSLPPKVPPKLKHSIPDITVIAESPIEERTHIIKLQPPVEIISGNEKRTSESPKTSGDRRRSFALFRKGDNSDAVSIKSSASSQRRKSVVATSLTNFRNSMLRPLSLTRTKSTDRQRLAPSTFDASHLPPSPTLPTFIGKSARQSYDTQLPHSQSTPALSKSFVTRPRAAKSALPSPPQSPRQAVSPKIHSRGSILVETLEITDEESRRLSEMAFLH